MFNLPVSVESSDAGHDSQCDCCIGSMAVKLARGQYESLQDIWQRDPATLSDALQELNLIKGCLAETLDYVFDYKPTAIVDAPVIVKAVFASRDDGLANLSDRISRWMATDVEATWRANTEQPSRPFDDITQVVDRYVQPIRDLSRLNDAGGVGLAEAYSLLMTYKRYLRSRYEALGGSVIPDSMWPMDYLLVEVIVNRRLVNKLWAWGRDLEQLDHEALGLARIHPEFDGAQWFPKTREALGSLVAGNEPKMWT
ncbi:hypothetical protein QBC35DRAFT_506012 [Podospora australis]|uniref:Uncharacterized protein n=1 Tax=Podospora australis TaxID=1536484 RepID=A0AAN6WQ99_9PEZI|nr:hypothetical protein QBC35DRAFT_506012 [Podospora australis]